jgi:hypothetical protein
LGSLGDVIRETLTDRHQSQWDAPLRYRSRKSIWCRNARGTSVRSTSQATFTTFSYKQTLAWKIRSPVTCESSARLPRNPPSTKRLRLDRARWRARTGCLAGRATPE